MVVRKNSKQGIQITDVLSLVLVVAYPCLYIFFKNISLILLKDVLATTGFFLLNGLVVYVFVYLFIRDAAKSFLITNISMLVLLTFNTFEKLIINVFPFLFYWHIVYILLTILVVLGRLIKRKLTDTVAVKINKVFLVIFGGLILFNLVMAAPTIIQTAKKEKNTGENIQFGRSNTKRMPNVYYFIFDEYGGVDSLQRYTGYDNAPFYDALKSMGFNVSPHSRNYSINTKVEISNLLNLSLTLSEANFTKTAQAEILRYPALFRLFKENGYQINLIDDQGLLPKDVEGVDHSYSPKNSLSKVETFQTVMIKNSIYYPLLLKLEEGRLADINNLFLEAEEFAGKQEGNLLTFGYIMAPHSPWVVDKNGNPINGSEQQNWKNPAVYLGQLKYVSKKIIELVKVILNEDPNSIIIIQSDHGFRLPLHQEALYDVEIEDKQLESYYQRNILNAVYFKGEAIDIENESGVNTLITTFNKLLEINITQVETPD